MLQNFKNFLIAFFTGLIVFGLCAVLILWTVTRISSADTDGETNVQQETQLQEQPEESDAETSDGQTAPDASVQTEVQ